MVRLERREGTSSHPLQNRLRPCARRQRVRIIATLCTLASLHGKFGHASIVSLLISRGVSVELSSEDECRPLFIAAQNGHAEVTKVLIEAGVELEFRFEGAFTAL